MLKENQAAIDFELPDENGRAIRLSDFSGKKIVLYFYPKDDTPGCSKEACGFRDVYDAILAKNAVVIGISKDSSAAHVRFKNKYNLPFYLLTDAEGRTIEAYGAWGEKKMMGRKYMGIFRCTYIIDEQFKIMKCFDKVKPDGHAQEILKLL